MTEYQEIFESFKDKITDPDLLAFAKDLEIEYLSALLRKSISRCKYSMPSTVNLTERNDELMVFSSSLSDEVIDILSEWMTVYWLKPYLNNADNLRNELGTKDFSVFSPANLLEKIGSRYDQAYKYARGMTNEYSFTISDFGELKK